MVENWSELVALLPSYGVRLGTAVLCGVILGIERERKDKPAGLRTIVLISFGSALYMLVSNLIPFVLDWPDDVTRADPSRIAAQVVTGIGFLGAGTIIQARGSVQGLTTAAVIWVAAGIGMCAGIGYPILAVLVTFVVLAALLAMAPLRDHVARRGEYRLLHLYVPDDELVMERVHHTLAGHDIEEDDVYVERASEDDVLRLTFTFRAKTDAASRFLEALARIDHVRGAPYGALESRDAPSSDR